MSSFMLYSCGTAVCDTYVLPGNFYWLSNVCSICQNVGFLMVLKGCKGCRLNAPVIVDCQKDRDGPSVALVVVFFPAGKTALDDYALDADACLLYCRF